MKTGRLLGVDYGSRRVYFVDIGTVIFSIEPHIVPFPVWRAKRDSARRDRAGERRQEALIVRLENKLKPGDRGPAPDPSAA